MLSYLPARIVGVGVDSGRIKLRTQKLGHKNNQGYLSNNYYIEGNKYYCLKRTHIPPPNDGKMHRMVYKWKTEKICLNENLLEEDEPMEKDADFTTNIILDQHEQDGKPFFLLDNGHLLEM